MGSVTCLAVSLLSFKAVNFSALGSDFSGLGGTEGFNGWVELRRYNSIYFILSSLVLYRLQVFRNRLEKAIEKQGEAV